MSTIFVPWAFAIVLGASLILQGIVLRTTYRRKVARQHTKHLQFRQAVNGHLVPEVRVSAAPAERKTRSSCSGEARRTATSC